ncbi:Chaperone protein DnaJ, partial [Frankliniella fusca]
MAARQCLSLVLAVMVLVAVEGTFRTRPRRLVPRKQDHQLLGGSGRPLGAPLTATATTQDCNGQLATCTSCTTKLECIKIAGSYRPVTTSECTG